MIEAAGGRFPPGTAAHDKGPHCRLTVDAVVEPFDPAVKPAPTQIEEIFCQIAVDRGGRAEIDIARISERAVAMRPRAEDQLCRLALWTREALVIFHRGAGIGVVPARQVHCRYTRIALVKPFGVDAGLPPEFVKRAARPLLEQVILVFRRGTDRGVASAPTAPRQPVERDLVAVFVEAQAAMSCAASAARLSGSRASASALRHAQVACFRSNAPPCRSRCDRHSRSRRNRETAR